MPWEISLPSDLIAHPLYAKAGAHPGHTSHLLISPDLNFAVIAFACGPSPNAHSLAHETERFVTPLLQKALGERTMEKYAGVYLQECGANRCRGCGEIVLEVDSEMKITGMRDCNGGDMFETFDMRCKKEECFAKLWPVGRAGEFRSPPKPCVGLTVGGKLRPRRRGVMMFGLGLRVWLLMGGLLIW
jgi:hypothetical protein